MGQAVSYLRVSTERQGKNGLGIEAQRERISRFAAAEGFEISEEFVEVETGKGSNALERRPVLREALATAKKAKAPIIIAKLDRLSRDTHFITGLMAQRVNFVVVELGVDVEPFMLQIYAAVAEEERRKISQRTKDALAAKKAAGGTLGNAATLVQVSEAGRVAQREAADRFAENIQPLIAAIQVTGVTTLQAIAEALNVRGVRTARGGTWHAKTVANVLARAPRDGTKSAKPIGQQPLSQATVAEIVAELQRGTGVLRTAKLVGCGVSDVQKIKKTMLWVVTNPASS